MTSSTSSIEMIWRRLTYPTALLGVTLGLFLMALRATGRPSGSAVFFALSGTLLVVSVYHLMRAAIALFAEPPAVEVAVATGRRRKELEREKQALLKALKELEFDHEMRKVSDDDFTEISGAYRARAIRVMRLLDDRQVDYAALVEEEVQRHRRRAGQGAPPAASPATVSPAAVSAAATSPAAVLPVLPVLERAPAAAAAPVPAACPSCGTGNDPDAVFCKKCATRLVAAEAGA